MDSANVFTHPDLNERVAHAMDAKMKTSLLVIMVEPQLFMCLYFDQALKKKDCALSDALDICSKLRLKNVLDLLKQKR